MSDEFIRPSWQDVAERWNKAYDEEHAKLERIRELCNQGEPSWIPFVSRAKVLAILDGND